MGGEGKERRKGVKNFPRSTRISRGRLVTNLPAGEIRLIAISESPHQLIMPDFRGFLYAGGAPSPESFGASPKIATLKYSSSFAAPI